jgi:hypothetical protein
VPKRPSPQREWEQALVDAYYDYRWRQVLQPLYDNFQRWAAGELTHADLDQAIHQTHKKTRELYVLFSEKREWLARVIQLDDDWYREWVKDHPAPARADQ